MQLGADIEHMERLARNFDQSSSKLDRSRTQIQSVLGSTFWQGRDADQFRAQWNQQLAANLRNAAQALTEQATMVRRQAQEQIQASNDSGGSFTGASGSGAGGGIGGGIGASGTIDDGFFGADGNATAGPIVDIGASSSAGSDGNGNYYAEGDAHFQSGVGASANGSVNAGPVYASGEAEIFLGVDAGASGEAHFGPDGIGASGSAHASAGVGASATGSYGIDGIYEHTVSAEGHVGGSASAEGGISVSPTQVSAGGEAGAYWGANGELSGNYSIFDGTAEAGGSVGGHVGFGANAGGDVAFGLEEIGVELDVGAAFGLGLDVSIDVSVNPTQIAGGAVDLADGAWDLGGDLIGGIGGWLD